MPSVKSTLFAVFAMASTISAAPNNLEKRFFDKGKEAVCSNDPVVSESAADTGVIPAEATFNNDLTIKCCMAQDDSENTHNESRMIHLQKVGESEICIAGTGFWSYNIDRPKFLKCCAANQVRAYYSPACSQKSCSAWDDIKGIGSGVLSVASIASTAASFGKGKIGGGATKPKTP